MWEWVLDLDKEYFLFVNHSLNGSWAEAIIPLLREKLFWSPLYLFIVSMVWLNYSRAVALRILLGLALAVTIADTCSSRLIKPSVARLRPCNDPELRSLVTLRAPCGTGYSFTSSHATNHFAVAVFLAGFLGSVRPWIRWALLLWAGSVAFAQVYVGVHYPIDVVCGALLGAGIGWATHGLARASLPRAPKPAPKDLPSGSPPVC